MNPLPDQLLAAFRASPLLQRGEGFSLYLQGEKSVGLWYVEEGRLLVSRIAENGRSVVMQILTRGSIAGLGSLISREKEEASCLTQAGCKLRLLASAELMALMQSDTEVCGALLQRLAGELAHLQRWIGNRLLCSNSTRLAKFLLESSQLELAGLTHSNIADRIGVTRESVTRMMGILKSSGALAVVKGQVVVSDRNVLAKMAA